MRWILPVITLVSLIVSPVLAPYDAVAGDLQQYDIRHVLQQKSYGNEASVDGATLSAGGDVNVSAFESVDGVQLLFTPLITFSTTDEFSS